MNELVSNYLAIESIFTKTKGELEKKMVLIIKAIAKALNKDNYWWDWEYLEESKGTAVPKFSKESVGVHVSVSLDDGVWMYHEDIPLIFFDMTEQEIFDHVSNNVKDAKAAEEKRKLAIKEKKAKTASNKKKKLELLENVLKKLSPEERKILKLKI